MGNITHPYYYHQIPHRSSTAGDVQALSSSLDDLDRQEDEELIAAATATEGRKLQTAKGKGRAWAENMLRFTGFTGKK